MSRSRPCDPWVELIVGCAGEAAHRGDSESFLAWMRTQAPQRFPAVFARFPAATARRAAFWLGVAIWNVTPLPDEGFEPRPLRLPRSGDDPTALCVCGSGMAALICCGDRPAMPDIPSELAWEAALARLPLERLRAAAAAGMLSPPRLAIVGRRLLEAGEPRQAMALLGPLFARPEQADESFAEALEMLFAAYLTLGLWKERQQLVERLTLELRPPLRARAWARRATMLADQGHHAEAWLAWERAHHDDPGDEALMQLEVTLLLVRGDLERARVRARFHLARIRRAAADGSGTQVDPGILVLLSEAAAHPAAVARRITHRHPARRGTRPARRRRQGGKASLSSPPQ